MNLANACVIPGLMLKRLMNTTERGLTYAPPLPTLGVSRRLP